MSRFDPEKLHILFCPAARAEWIAKEAVLRDLRLRAKSAGKRIRGGAENILGHQRCTDIRWLYPTLELMRQEFAALIDEDLQKLKEPDADRETLVGNIYTHILCIRATITIFMGDGEAAPAMLRTT